MSRLIEALSHSCITCSEPLKNGDRIHAAYKLSDVQSFAKQVELGIIGQGVRNTWSHLLCSNPTLKGFNLQPDLHSCIECKRKLGKEDLVVPVYQVIDPRAVNPYDPTDIGITLGERVYLVHQNCRNIFLDQSSNLLHKG